MSALFAPTAPLGHQAVLCMHCQAIIAVGKHDPLRIRIIQDRVNKESKQQAAAAALHL